MNMKLDQEEALDTQMTAVERMALKRKLQQETSRQPSRNGSPPGSRSNSPTKVEPFSPNRRQMQSNTIRDFGKKHSLFSPTSNTNLLSAPTLNRYASTDDAANTQNEVYDLKQSMNKMSYETTKQIENMRLDHAKELKRIRKENKELKRLIQAGFNNLSHQNSDSASTANIANNIEDSARWSDNELEEMSLSTRQKDL